MGGSQRAKKNAYVTKLKQALSADEATLCEALEPYKRFIAPEHVEEVKKDEKLLGAWVARLTQLLAAEKLEQLHAVILVCNMQVFRCFEEATKTIGDSKLIPFLVKCVAALRDNTADETAGLVLECALDMAEMVVEVMKIRSEFFIPAASDLVSIATNLEHKVSNRRACLEVRHPSFVPPVLCLSYFALCPALIPTLPHALSPSLSRRCSAPASKARSRTGQPSMPSS